MKGGDYMKGAEQLHVYITDEQKPMIIGLKKLGKELHIRPSRLIMACVEACYPTLIEKAPKERSFKMNGRKIIV